MNKWLVISVVIFAALAFGAYSWVKGVISRLSFNVYFSNVSLANTNIAALITNRGVITFNFLIKVKNANGFTIPIRDLETRIYYKGQLIGNSSATALKDIDILPGSFKQWIEPVDIHVKSQIVGQAIADLGQFKDPLITFTTEMKIWGIRYKYSERIQVVQTALEEL